MHRAISSLSAAATATCLVLIGPAAASPRVPDGTEVLKGAMSPAGTIRFQAIPTRRGEVPRLDRFRLHFDCRDGLGPTGSGAGAAPGSSIRPNAQRKFRIRSGDPTYTFDLRGRFNRRFTKAAGTFRFTGDIGDGRHTDCDTGKLTWQAKVKP